jgi:hypothetical protein
MRKVFLPFICLFLFGCATDPNYREAVLQETDRVEGVTFETGKAKGIVMNVIMDIVMDDGFDVDPITDETGNIVCKPRGMLSGILQEKTEGKKWIMPNKRATMNYRVLLSAHVSEKGIVQVKAVVIEPGFAKSIDLQKSEKLAEYYERKIKKKLRALPARTL